MPAPRAPPRPCDCTFDRNATAMDVLRFLGAVSHTAPPKAGLSAPTSPACAMLSHAPSARCSSGGPRSPLPEIPPRYSQPGVLARRLPLLPPAKRPLLSMAWRPGLSLALASVHRCGGNCHRLGDGCGTIVCCRCRYRCRKYSALGAIGTRTHGTQSGSLQTGRRAIEARRGIAPSSARIKMNRVCR